MNGYELFVITTTLILAFLGGAIVGGIVEHIRTIRGNKPDETPTGSVFHNVAVDLVVGHAINFNVDIDGEQESAGLLNSRSIMGVVHKFHETKYGIVNASLFIDLEVWNEPGLPVHIQIDNVLYRVDFYVQSYGNKTYEWEKLISG